MRVFGRAKEALELLKVKGGAELLEFAETDAIDLLAREGRLESLEMIKIYKLLYNGLRRGLSLFLVHHAAARDRRLLLLLGVWIRSFGDQGKQEISETKVLDFVHVDELLDLAVSPRDDLLFRQGLCFLQRVVWHLVPVVDDVPERLALPQL